MRGQRSERGGESDSLGEKVDCGNMGGGRERAWGRRSDGGRGWVNVRISARKRRETARGGKIWTQRIMSDCQKGARHEKQNTRHELT